MNPLLGYRRDIDGLRAVAVLPVVLFHLGVAPFSGGFVGVDVFFVISGFLITSIVYREVQNGEFSYARFYERRIRRLFPALAVMLLVTGVVAWFLLLPADYKLFSEAQGLAVLFLANIHFWNKTDYFNDAVANIPLLHTWSLSVEEQFYILFPPLLLLLVRFVPRRINLILLGLAILSLFGAQRALSSTPESAFYLVHLRAWELLSGALLATGLLPAHRWQWVRELSSLSGLALILGSVFLLDKDSSFPGVSALPAVLGSLLIIHAGQTGTTLVGRLLGWRLLVFIGLISYSLYLWHWPLFVFAGYYKITPFTPLEQMGLLMLSILFGWLSWRFVESRFRGKSNLVLRRQFFKRAGWVAGLLILISLPGMISKGAAFRLPDQVAEIASVENEKIPFQRGCFGSSVEDVDQEKDICTLGVQGEASFLLWGDSHALSLAHGFNLVATEQGRSGRFLARSVCPPVLGSREFKASRVSCAGFNAAVVRYLERHPEIHQVILVGVWSNYLRGDAKLPDTDADQSFVAGYERTLEYLKSSGRQVTVIEQVPLIDYNVPQTLARVSWFERDLKVRLSRQQHDNMVQPAKTFFASIAERYPLVRVDLTPLLCNEQFCQVSHQGQPLYRDSNHLSKYGSTFVSPLLGTTLEASLYVHKGE